MITLPPGFDASALVADYYAAGVVVVGVVALCVAARYIIAALKGGR